MVHKRLAFKCIGVALWLSAANMASAQPEPWVYTVSGAGLAGFNGTYTFEDSFSGFSYGSCVSSDGCAALGGNSPIAIKDLIYYESTDTWYLYEYSGSYLYSAPATCGATAPPTTGWQVNNVNPNTGDPGWWVTNQNLPWNPWPASAGAVPTVTRVSGPECAPPLTEITDGPLTGSVTGTGGWVFAPVGTGPEETRGFLTLAEAQNASLVVGAPTGNLQALGELFTFRLILGTSGSQATVTIDFGGPIPAGAQYWKYGPQTNGGSSEWYVFEAAVIDNQAGTVTLPLTDGALGDADWAENSVITDPGGLFAPQAGAQPIPTLTEWGMIIMASLMALGAMVTMRRRID